jgi:hypothetical protein
LSTSRSTGPPRCAGGPTGLTAGNTSLVTESVAIFLFKKVVYLLPLLLMGLNQWCVADLFLCGSDSSSEHFLVYFLSNNISCLKSVHIFNDL